MVKKLALWHEKKNPKPFRARFENTDGQTNRQTDRQTDRRTWRLYDQLGRVGENLELIQNAFFMGDEEKNNNKFYQRNIYYV